MKRERTVILLYFVILLTAIAGMKTVINEFKAEIEELQDENKQLDSKIAQLEKENKKLNQSIVEYQTESKKLKEKIKSTTSRGFTSRALGEFTVTCYDLSVQSCGKSIGSKGYGITASGISLKGHTWETARAIAVDPKVIPLGSKVELIFTNEKYSQYNGIYHAVDTGGAIKGNKIDFFLGDFNQNKTHQSVWDFGKTKAYVKVLKGR